jgi:hypothetical protein
MNRITRTYTRTVLLAGLGIVMSIIGLYFSYLSNPRRFSLAIANDKYIHGFLAAGMGLTLVGAGLFLYAAKGTTAHFSPKLRREVNTAIGIGFALQCTGLLVTELGPQAQSVGFALALLLVLCVLVGGGAIALSVSKYRLRANVQSNELGSKRSERMRARADTNRCPQNCRASLNRNGKCPWAQFSVRTTSSRF